MSWQFNTNPLLNSETLLISFFFHSFVFCVTLCSASSCQLATQCCTSVAGSASSRSGGAVVWSRVPATCFLCYCLTKRFLLSVPCPSPWFMLTWAQLLNSVQCVTKRALKFPEMFSLFMDIIEVVNLFLHVQINLTLAEVLSLGLIWYDLTLYFMWFFVIKVLTGMRCLFLW